MGSEIYYLKLESHVLCHVVELIVTLTTDLLAGGAVATGESISVMGVRPVAAYVRSPSTVLREGGVRMEKGKGYKCNAKPILTGNFENR